MDSNADLCFLFMVAEDWKLAKRLIRQLAFIFPLADKICIADGTKNKDFALFCKNHKVNYIEGEALFLAKFGGKWTERAFQFYLSCSSKKRLVKLDPDSYILRQFTELPNGDFCGSILELKNNKFFIQGGANLFKREAVEKIIESQLLHDSKYINNSLFRYQRYSHPYLQTGETENLNYYKAEDHINTDIANRLELTIDYWHDVYSRVRERCPSPKDYAIVHPVKQLTPYWS